MFFCVWGRLSTVVNERTEDGGGVGFIVKNGYNSIFFG